MTVTKNGTQTKPWRVDVRDASGYRHRPAFKTKREAQEFETMIRLQSRTTPGLDVRAARKTTVGMIFPMWIEKVTTTGTDGRGPAKPRTLKDYRHSWDAHVAPRWEYVTLDNVRHQEVETWIQTMPARDGSGVAGNRPRAEAAKTLRRILDHAVLMGYLPSNPALNPLGRLPKLPTSERRTEHSPLTMSQLRLLASHAGQWSNLILLAGTSAPRFGELAALTGSSVVRHKKQLRITQAWSDVGGKLHLGLPKGNRPRTAPILPSVMELLPHKSDDDALWRGPRGGVLRGKFFREKVLYPAVEKARSDDSTFPEKFWPHDLRHTAVSIALSTGANVKVVQSLAGHQKATITLDTYGGMFDHELLEMADAVEIMYQSDPLERN